MKVLVAVKRVIDYNVKPRVTREVDGGLETVALTAPPIVTTTSASTSRATPRCTTS